MKNRHFRAHADVKDFNDHLNFLMREAERVHKLGMKADATRKRAVAQCACANRQYRRCYREMEQIVEEMQQTRKMSEKLFP